MSRVSPAIADTFRARCVRAWWRGVPVPRIATALNTTVANVEMALFTRVAG